MELCVIAMGPTENVKAGEIINSNNISSFISLDLTSSLNTWFIYQTAYILYVSFRGIMGLVNVTYSKFFISFQPSSSPNVCHFRQGVT